MYFKNKALKIIIISCGIIVGGMLYGQQLPNYNQYVTNFFLINPAAAGAEGYTAFNFTAREQWLGLKDGPRTHAITAQSRILKNSFIRRGHSVRKRRSYGRKSGNNGYGAYLFDDRNGALHRMGLQGTYSYHLRVRDVQFSGGMSLIGYQVKLRDAVGSEYAGNDPLFYQKPKFGVDANMGVFAMHSQYTAGFSIANLIEMKPGKDEEEIQPLERNYNLHGSYIHRYGRLWKYEPSVLLKWPEGHVPQADINFKGTYRGEYWGGLTYRTGHAIVMFYGMKFDKYYFSYAFEYTLQNISKYTFGSHEFSLAVKFGENARRYRWLNRY